MKSDRYLFDYIDQAAFGLYWRDTEVLTRRALVLQGSNDSRLRCVALVMRCEDGSWRWSIDASSYVPSHIAHFARAGVEPTKLLAISAAERELQRPVLLPSHHPVMLLAAQRVLQRYAAPVVPAIPPRPREA